MVRVAVPAPSSSNAPAAAGTELVAASARTPPAATTGPTTRPGSNSRDDLLRAGGDKMSDARMPVATGALESGASS